MDNNEIEILQFIKADMEQIYQEHRFAQTQIMATLKLFLSIGTLPVLSSAALLTAGVLKIDNSFSFFELPLVLSTIFIITGAFNVLPLIKIVHFHSVENHCKNAINNFRKLYVDGKNKSGHEYLKDWKSFLPTNKNYPKQFRIHGQEHITIILISLINALYFATGLTALFGQGHLLFGISGFVLVMIEYLFYRFKISKFDKDR